VLDLLAFIAIFVYATQQGVIRSRAGASAG
jgi:hypothetical protein